MILAAAEYFLQSGKTVLGCVNLPLQVIVMSRRIRVSRTPKKAVLFLCLFFGIFGVHRFYLQKFRSGALQLFTLGGLGIWALRDFFKILNGEFTDERGFRIQR